MIEVRTGISRSGITKTRKALSESGLIEFQNTGKSTAAIYRIIPFGSEIVSTNVTTNVATKVTTDEESDDQGVKKWPQMESQKSPILKHSSSPIVIDSSPSKVEQHFIMKRNRGFGLTPDDYAAIHEVINYGIPVEFISDVIDKAFKEYKPKYPRDGITNFTYIAPRIYKEWHLKQEKEKGVQTFEKLGRSDEGVRPGSDQKKGTADQGESKVYRGKWDDTEVPMPKVSG